MRSHTAMMNLIVRQYEQQPMVGRVPPKHSLQGSIPWLFAGSAAEWSATGPENQGGG
jgi:hypothetical protein